MAEFQKVMKELYRICVIYNCSECPISEANVNCNIWIKRHPEEAERIIMEWAVAHPAKTNRDKFKEVFGIEYYDLLLRGYSEWLNAEYKEEQNGNT